MRKLILLLATATFAFASTINVPGDYPTIQAAIDAVTTVDGDIIQIDAGTYTEALTVGKSLTFIGSGPTSNPTTIITSTASRVIKLTVTGKSFTFQNLIVEGIDTNLGIYAGSSIDINSLTMQDVIARNCKVALYLAEYWSGGVFLTTSVTNLSMDNVTLTNNKFIGAYIGKTVLTGTVTNCTVTDNGYSDELPNGWQKTGLQFVNFDEASVPHVVVTNSTFSNNGAGASNIERTGLIIYTAYNALSASEIMTVSGCSFSNHPLYAVRIKNGYNEGNTATVNGTFSSNYLDIWFNNIIGTTSSTTLVRNTFDGIKTVGVGPTYDYNTIQAAIDAASSGDVINVAAGIYYENVVIAKSDLTLRGPNAGINPITATRVAEAILDGSGLPTGPGILLDMPTLAVDQTNVIIEGFEIRNYTGTAGIDRPNIGNKTSDNISIRNNKIHTITGHGINFQRSGEAVLPNPGGVVIEDNLITNILGTDKTGIIFYYNRAPVANPNYIIGNKIDGTTYAGIQLNSSHNTIISQNQVLNIQQQGIYISTQCANIEISDNVITNANLLGAAEPDKGGITFKYPESLLGWVSITGNVISGSYNGISIREKVTFDITGKDIRINNNNLSDNSNSGIYHGGIGNLDAPLNWFGTNTPSGVAAKVVGNVDYSPWLANGTDTNPNPGFQGDFSKLWVDDDSPQYGIVGHIQEGIDLVSGSTVNIAAGRYIESVHINKHVKLIGAGSGESDLTNTVVEQTGSNVFYLEASGISEVDPILFQNFRIEPINRYAIEIHNGQNIEYFKMDNIIIDGGDPTIENLVGLRIATTGNLSYVEISNCLFTNLDYGWYFAKHGDWGPGGSNAHHFTVSNTDFIGNYFKGIYVEKLEEISFTNCNFTNNGSHPFWNNDWNAGVDINLKGNRTYSNFLFDGCNFEGNAHGYKEGAALMIKGRDDGGTYGANPASVNNVEIFNCSFINNERGIRFGEPNKGNLTPINVVVEGCNISGNVQHYSGVDGTTYGGLINMTSNTVPITATCNWWGAVDGPSGSGSGSGDAVTDYVKYLPWLVTSDLNGSCIGGTLLGDKYGVRDDLAALTPSGDKKTDDRIKKAIKHIDKSLADKLWEDGNYLTKDGKKVFDEEKKAVKELNKIVKEKKDKPLKDEARDAIAKLITIDESLARLMIDKAIANSGDSKEIDKAEREFDKAQKEIDKEHWDHVIDKYKKAWEHAYHALKKVGLGKYSTPTDDLTVSTTPEEFALGNNYPNPFNPTTLISYNLPEASQVTMTVFDLMGRKVKSLVQEFQPAGNHSVIWNATNDNGAKMSGGMYFYQIRAGTFQQTHKMILLK